MLLSINHGKKMFFEQILKLIKVEEKIMKNSLSTSCPFWQQEEYKLTSADVLYQMVGLFDDIKAFHSHVQYIWGSFWLT